MEVLPATCAAVVAAGAVLAVRVLIGELDTVVSKKESATLYVIGTVVGVICNDTKTPCTGVEVESSKIFHNEVDLGPDMFSSI